tara:strand:+ start:934 stop:1146 length:213 start_codon:yes stop_codon:yes gene_type:complete
MIKLERKSPKTGKVNSMVLDTTKEALDSYYAGEGLIQVIFPQLNENEREFIKSGYTPEDWDEIFPPEDFE